MESNTEKTAGSNLTPIAEYTETAAALADLRQRHAGVVYDVTVPKQMKLAKEACAELRGLRTGLEKKRVEIKAPALERCRLIDAEAKRITAELVALEEPIDVQIKAEEARAETERLAKLEAERLRVEGIVRAIEEIRNVPGSLIGKPAVIVEGQLAKLRAQVLEPEFYAERFREAEDALAATIARVEQQLAAQREQEAEQKRIAAERAELERMRAENERLRREAEERAAAERVEADRKAQEERDRIAAEEAAARAAEQAEQERLAAIERGKQMAAAAAERDRLAAERQGQEAALQAERERQAAEQRRLDEQAEQLRKDKAAAAKKAEADRLANLGLREAAQAVVDHFEGQVKPKCIYDLAAVLDNTATARTVNRGKRSAVA